LTQSALFGLHEFLFTILRKMPNDGTFDQGAAFQRAVSKAKRTGYSFGYDLSAATDRLPLSLQTVVLGTFIGSKAAGLWEALLVGRSYHVGINQYGVPQGDYRYAVGQPMGAYSSWAMLAITHHLIVQYSFKRAAQLG